MPLSIWQLPLDLRQKCDKEAALTICGVLVLAISELKPTKTEKRQVFFSL